jgi:hypothetical protein
MQAVIPIALREQWIQERILEVFPGANIIPLTVEVMQEKLLYHDDNQTHIDNWSISWMVWTPKNVNKQQLVKIHKKQQTSWIDLYLFISYIKPVQYWNIK